MGRHDRTQMDGIDSDSTNTTIIAASNRGDVPRHYLAIQRELERLDPYEPLDLTPYIAALSKQDRFRFVDKIRTNFRMAAVKVTRFHC